MPYEGVFGAEYGILFESLTAVVDKLACAGNVGDGRERPLRGKEMFDKLLQARVFVPYAFIRRARGVSGCRRGSHGKLQWAQTSLLRLENTGYVRTYSVVGISPIPFRRLSAEVEFISLCLAYPNAPTYCTGVKQPNLLVWGFFGES